MGEAYNHKTIGGTGASAVVGQNPYKSRHGLWLELLNKVTPQPDNEAMARGRKWESVVAEMFRAAHPEYRVFESDNPCFFGRYAPIIDSEIPYLTGQPDRMLLPENDPVPAAGLEIKTAELSTIAEWGEPGTDQIPFHYLIQCQWYLGLCNLKKWHLAALFFIDEKPKLYREYEIEFDAALYDSLRKKAIGFWERYVATGNEPPLDFADSTTARYVKEKYPLESNPVRLATEEEESLISNLILAQIKIKEAEKEFEALKLKAQMLIGDSEGLTGQAGKVTWKATKERRVIDWQKVAESFMPSESLIEQYTEIKPGYRIFRVSGKRG